MLPGGDGQEASGSFPTYKSDGGGHGGGTDGAQTTRAIWIWRLLRHTASHRSIIGAPLKLRCTCKREHRRVRELHSRPPSSTSSLHSIHKAQASHSPALDRASLSSVPSLLAFAHHNPNTSPSAIAATSPCCPPSVTRSTSAYVLSSSQPRPDMAIALRVYEDRRSLAPLFLWN